MKQRILPPLNGVHYANISMLSPTGELMSYISEQKADWYLSRNLAKVISENPVKIQLTFLPQGLGNHNHPYHMAPKENLCVVCGTTENLTRHHCVPRCFRKHFPDEHKINASHDVVVLCYECHSNYEVYASELKQTLIDMYGRESKQDELQQSKIVKLASAYFLPQVPPSRKDEIKQIISEYFGDDATDELMLSLLDCEIIKHGAAKWREVVEHIDDIDTFIKMWRTHFVSIAKPKYLPEHWDIHYQHNH